MTTPERVTVVGNGVAGYACARRLAERDVPVTLVGPGIPCDRPPLSKRALERGSLPYLTTPERLAAAGIDHLDGLATGLDLTRRSFSFRPVAGGDEHVVEFGPLVWATGLAVGRPPVPGIETTDQNAVPSGAQAVFPRLAGEGRRVVVIGAGLIGCETAATLARRHRVTLLERAPRPLDRLAECVRGAAEVALEQTGVALLTGCDVEQVEQTAAGARLVHTSTHGVIAADVVLAATGVGATLPPALGGGRSIDTDSCLAVSGLERVWACGDVAAFPHPRFGRIAVPHWDHAQASGAHAADAVLGGTTAYARDPYWFSDIGPLRIQQVGLADAACEWAAADGLHVGHDTAGRPACVVLLDAPQRLNDARRLLAAA
jgi:NADPH-dependent 2,4-dienoyl-CoA reductase/sulfur reductase-like enzyme